MPLLLFVSCNIAKLQGTPADEVRPDHLVPLSVSSRHLQLSSKVYVRQTPVARPPSHTSF